MRRIFRSGGMDRSLASVGDCGADFHLIDKPGVFPKAGGGLGTNRAADPVQPLGESVPFGFPQSA